MAFPTRTGVRSSWQENALASKSAVKSSVLRFLCVVSWFFLGFCEGVFNRFFFGFLGFLAGGHCVCLFFLLSLSIRFFRYF